MTGQKTDKKVTISAKVTPAVYRKISAVAKRKDRKVSYVVNQLLEKYFANN